MKNYGKFQKMQNFHEIYRFLPAVGKIRIIIHIHELKWRVRGRSPPNAREIFNF